MTPVRGRTAVQYPTSDQVTVVADDDWAVAGRAHITMQLMSAPHPGIGMGLEVPPWWPAMSIIMAQGCAAAACPGKSGPNAPARKAPRAMIATAFFRNNAIARTLGLRHG